MPSVDIGQFVDGPLLGLVGYAVIATGGLVTWTKPFIERRVATTDPRHDSLVKLASCAWGVVTLLVALFVFDRFRSFQQVGFDVLVGVGVGKAASGNYRMLTWLVGPLTPVAGKLSKLALRQSKDTGSPRTSISR